VLFTVARRALGVVWPSSLRAGAVQPAFVPQLPADLPPFNRLDQKGKLDSNAVEPRIAHLKDRAADVPY
jgi:hypothetical protein